MAHFAKLDENNVVLAVHVVDNANTSSDEGVEEEWRGRNFLEKIHFYPNWKQTSYNTYRNTHLLGGTPFRGNYAGIGMIYDEANDIFIEQQPYPSWTKNLSTASWEPPIAKPDFTDEQNSQNAALTHLWVYTWNESGQTWDLSDTMQDV